MSKKREDLTYSFQPTRALTLEEVTALIQKIVGSWRMSQEQYDNLDKELKDVFAPVKE